MNWLRAYAEKIYRNLGQYFRWLLFGVVTGVAVGLFASLFSWCLIQVTAFRMGHRYMFLTLPLGGLLIVFTYKAFHFENNGGTDSVIESIHSEITIPFRMALLIFSSTIITILCGGSVGREGAALQIGGSIGKKHFDERHGGGFCGALRDANGSGFFCHGGFQCGDYVLCGAGALYLCGAHCA